MLAPLICLALFVAGVFGIVLGAARAASVDGGNKGQREVGLYPYISRNDPLNIGFSDEDYDYYDDFYDYYVNIDTLDPGSTSLMGYDDK